MPEQASGKGGGLGLERKKFAFELGEVEIFLLKESQVHNHVNG